MISLASVLAILVVRPVGSGGLSGTAADRESTWQLVVPSTLLALPPLQLLLFFMPLLLLLLLMGGSNRQAGRQANT